MLLSMDSMMMLAEGGENILNRQGWTEAYLLLRVKAQDT